MFDLHLESGEAVISYTSEAWSYDGHKERELESLYLTNKNLISVYEKGMFSRKPVIDKIPLSDIQKKKGQLQIRYFVDDNFGDTIQVIHKSGAMMYFLGDVPESEYTRWEKDIIDAAQENVQQ